MAPRDRGICRLVPGAVQKDQCEEADVQYHKDLDDESKRICKQEIPCGPVIEERYRRPAAFLPPPMIRQRARGRKTVKRRTRRRRSTRRQRH
jgi:hypothetical protein